MAGGEALVLPGVHQIDTRLGGWEQVTAGYLIDGPAPVLVETGSQSSVPVVLDALSAMGLGPDDLAGVVVTHVHLDHAGGAGDVARAFPRATLYVHPRGARHLVDPTRLVASAATVYGAALDSLYGRLRPTEAGRVKALEDGERIDVGGGRHLDIVHSPGHAKHHLAVHDDGSGALFVGDAVGVRLPGAGPLRPATPPADFDLAQALDSLRRFGERGPAAIALAHYGVVPGAPQDILAEAADVLNAWAAVAAAAWATGADVEESLWATFGAQLDQLNPEQRRRVEALNGVHSNAEGLKLWLAKADGAPAPAS
jgi:glyoxylase-like metal-dependent hydrolase (beta-lactamase superfamily II)